MRFASRAIRRARTTFGCFKVMATMSSLVQGKGGIHPAADFVCFGINRTNSNQPSQTSGFGSFVWEVLYLFIPPLGTSIYIYMQV